MYAQTLVPHIHQASCKAMSALSEEQQNELQNLMNLYVSAFRKEMLGE